MAGDPVAAGCLVWIGRATVPLTFVHPSDLAAYLAAAADADAEAGERIDIGWDRPVSMREVADVMGRRAGKKIKVWAVRSAVARFVGGPIHQVMRRYRFVEDGLIVGRPETADVVTQALHNAELW